MLRYYWLYHVRYLPFEKRCLVVKLFCHSDKKWSLRDCTCDKKCGFLSWLVIGKIWHKFPLNSLSSFKIHFHSRLSDLQELKLAMNERISDVSFQVTKQFGSQRLPALFRATSLHPLESLKKTSVFFRGLIIEKIWHTFPLMWIRCFQSHFCCSPDVLQDRKEARNEQSADLTLEVAKEIRSQKFPALFAATILHCLGWNFLQTVGSLTVATTAFVLSYNCRFLSSKVREYI